MAVIVKERRQEVSEEVRWIHYFDIGGKNEEEMGLLCTE